MSHDARLSHDYGDRGDGNVARRTRFGRSAQEFRRQGCNLDAIN